MAAAIDYYSEAYVRALPANAELDTRQACIFLGISKSHFYNLISDGKGPRRMKERGRYFFIKSDLASWRKTDRNVIEAFR